MLLTKRSQYSIRMLAYLAHHRGERVSIEAVAAAQGLSYTHMVKVSQNLSRAGYIRGVRGRGGGIALAMDSKDIRLGDVVRDCEYSTAKIECDLPDCHKRPNCPLKRCLAMAEEGFLVALNQYTLADIAAESENSKVLGCVG